MRPVSHLHSNNAQPPQQLLYIYYITSTGTSTRALIPLIANQTTSTVAGRWPWFIAANRLGFSWLPHSVPMNGDAISTLKNTREEDAPVLTASSFLVQLARSFSPMAFLVVLLLHLHGLLSQEAPWQPFEQIGFQKIEASSSSDHHSLAGPSLHAHVHVFVHGAHYMAALSYRIYAAHYHYISQWAKISPIRSRRQLPPPALPIAGESFFLVHLSRL